MEFTFKVQEPHDTEVEIFVYADRVSVGRLLFLVDEWNLLKAMLVHGGSWFQRDEGTIVIEDRSAVPAFMVGV
jgi:hypothetical protein